MNFSYTGDSSGCSGSAHAIIQLTDTQNCGSACRTNSTDARSTSGITVAVAHYAVDRGSQSNHLRMALNCLDLTCDAELVHISNRLFKIVMRLSLGPHNLVVSTYEGEIIFRRTDGRELG
jgi:hypothetical protein